MNEESVQNLALPPRHDRAQSYLYLTLPLIYLIAVADAFGGLVQSYVPAVLLLRTLLLLAMAAHIAGMAARGCVAARALLALSLYLLARVGVNFFFNQEPVLLSVEVGGTLRLLYFPLMLLYLKDQLDRGWLKAADVLRLIQAYGWLILLSLLLGQVTGLGGAIVGRGKGIEAGKGFMIGANEVGLMLLLTTICIGETMTRLFRSRLLSGVLQLIMYGMAGIYVFTKSSLVALVITLITTYKAFVGHGPRMARFIHFVIAAIILLIFWYLQNTIDVVLEFVNRTFFFTLLDEGVLAFLFRGRDTYINAILPNMLNSDWNWIFLIFGSGEYWMRQVSAVPLMLDPNVGTNFEMDFFDLVGAYGLLGLVGYLTILVFLLRTNRRYRMYAPIKLVLISTFAHSFLAGHVLFSPQVTTLLTLVFLLHSTPSSTMRQIVSCQQKN